MMVSPGAHVDIVIRPSAAKFCQEVMARISNDLDGPVSAPLFIKSAILDCWQLQHFFGLRIPVDKTNGVEPVKTNLGLFRERLDEYCDVLRKALAATYGWKKSSRVTRFLAATKGLVRGIEDYKEARLNMFVCCGMPHILDAPDPADWWPEMQQNVNDLISMIGHLKRMKHSVEKKVSQHMLNLIIPKLSNADEGKLKPQMAQLKDMFLAAPVPKDPMWADVAGALIAFFGSDVCYRGKAAFIVDIMDKSCENCAAVLREMNLVAVGGCGFYQASNWPWDLARDTGGRIMPQTAYKHEIKELHVVNSPTIRSLPFNLPELASLNILNMHGCTDLQQLPATIGELQGLQYLKLSQCRRLSSLPDSIGELTNLLELDLQQCNALRVLPNTLGGLCSLINLNVMDCKHLTVLPTSLCSIDSLESLNLRNCASLQMLPTGLSRLPNLAHLHLTGCGRLKSIPRDLVENPKLSILAQQDLYAAAAAAQRRQKSTLIRELSFPGA